MDIQRPELLTQRRRKRLFLMIAGAVLVAAVTLGLASLKPAAPVIERSAVWIDTVKRGPMLRQVRGSGTLVPEEIRWIPATTEGRVERILALPGTVVKADTVLLELSNPELVVAAQDAASELKAAQAEYTNLKVQLRSALLTQ